MSSSRPRRATASLRWRDSHCGARSDNAIHAVASCELDCFASLAATTLWELLASLSLLSRGDVDAGQHQREADEMKGSRDFAKEDHRHDSAEHRHHMEEGCCAVGADQLDAAIEAEIGDDRWKHRDIEQRQQIVYVERHPWTGEELIDQQRNQ